MTPQILNKLKIIIVDDSNTFRNGLKMLLEKKYNFDVIAEASNAEEFMQLKELIYADVVLMDIVMPKTDGIDCTKNILWQYPELKIIAVTMHTDKAYLTELIEAGFKGCILKNVHFNIIENAIHKVAKGELFFPDDLV